MKMSLGVFQKLLCFVLLLGFMHASLPFAQGKPSTDFIADQDEIDIYVGQGLSLKTVSNASNWTPKTKGQYNLEFGFSASHAGSFSKLSLDLVYLKSKQYFQYADDIVIYLRKADRLFPFQYFW